jgi:hypothetical protein
MRIALHLVPQERPLQMKKEMFRLAPLCGLLALAGAVAGGVARGQDFTTANPVAGGQRALLPSGTRAAIGALQSSKWRVRRAAEGYVLRRSPAQLPLVVGTMQQARSPELRKRLTSVAVHLRYKQQDSMGGSVCLLGVVMRVVEMPAMRSTDSWRPAALVLHVQPGFPARALLHAGDLITAVNQHRLPPQFRISALRRMIMGMAPGSAIELSVVRGTRSLLLRVPLGVVPVQPGQVDAYMFKRIVAARRLSKALWRMGQQKLIVGGRPLGGPTASSRRLAVPVKPLQ